ncbi:hypothetical protein KKF82_04250, partial [Patescibacteria group bacterium]|nr:hypothetical protein [Patescibacteria group bacterium]
MPTIEIRVAANSDDCETYWDGTAWKLALADAYLWAGYGAATWLKGGGGMRFLNVLVPQGATIVTAYITFTCRESRDLTVVNTRLTGEKTGDAATFSNLANYQARRGTVVGGATDDNITDAQVDWDGIGAWSAGVEYDSPELKTIIQEIVDQVAWAPGNDIVNFWDDHENRSTQTDGRVRRAHGHASDPAKAALLHVEYLPQLVATIQPMTEVLPPTAKAHGTIDALGETPCTQHGHCWNTTGTPTIDDDKTELGAVASAPHPFESTLTGLLKSTLYYVRAYATDGDGTVYSPE